MELLGQLGIAILSLIITILANTAAHVMPRPQAQQSSQAQASMPSTEQGIEYNSLQSAALGKELKYAVMLPPSYKAEAKRRYPVLYFLHGMFGNAVVLAVLLLLATGIFLAARRTAVTHHNVNDRWSEPAEAPATVGVWPQVSLCSATPFDL